MACCRQSQFKVRTWQGMGVYIRRGIKWNKIYVFGEGHKPQAFRITADNDSLFDNFHDHSETETGNSFETLEYIYLRRAALN